MEFESGGQGSEPGFARELRQGQFARQQELRGERSCAEVLVWWQAWLGAWPKAKKVAMGKVGVFGQPQGGLWTRDQAKAWLEAEWTVLEIGALREIGNSVRPPCPHDINELPGIYAYIF